MFRTTPFDKLLDKATSHLLMEPDWRTIMEIIDLIRQNDVQPKHALAGIKKKLFHQNPHSAYYALLVLESIVKNCGSAVHEELNSKAYVDTLHELAKTTQHEIVRNKILELIQTWTFAFRKNPKYIYLKDIMNQMTQEGIKFPALRESDAMFSTDTAPEWADGEVCHRCRVAFSIVQRKHHCRNCGQVFCNQCSQKTTTLPKYGIEKEVRVCDTCYDTVTKPSSIRPDAKDTELPAEYLNSSLAQQSQSPPKKSEEELREEEELQLALALSQSEAEANEKISKTILPEENYPPELNRYLNRYNFEKRQSEPTTVDSPVEQNRATSPTAPATAPNNDKYRENGVSDNEIDEFVKALKSQVEIFVNRMKSNSSRGRSIANDSSVQTLFMNITQMHSKLLHYIQRHDDSRLHYERLQDKLTQVKDARAALDALRDEHREKLRRQAEEAERQRQLQMAHKLEIMRKKKQEYLQYQRQLALQRIQEQEREMQMRQEQQKQQYLMGGSQYAPFMGSPVHGQHFVPNPAPPMGAYGGYQYNMSQHVMAPQAMPQQVGSPGMGPPQGPGMPQNPSRMQHPPGFPSGLPQQPLPQQLSQHRPPGMMPPPGMGPQQMMGPAMPHGVGSQTVLNPGQPVMPQQFSQQPGAPPASPQVQQQQQQGQGQQNGEAQTAELISFD